jgi:hypothetical protein
MWDTKHHHWGCKSVARQLIIEIIKPNKKKLFSSVRKKVYNIVQIKPIAYLKMHVG